MQYRPKYILTLLLLALPIIGFSQYYLWDNKPKPKQIPDSLKKESAVIVLEKRHIQYLPDAKNDEISVFRTVHRRVKVLDDKGVEGFNTTTIGSAPGTEVSNLKARTIKADGTLITLQQEQIKTNKDEFGQNQFHIAFEALEPGDEVEMVYTEKRPFQVFGMEVMQFAVPIMEASFSLESPDFLAFETKGYNQFPNATDSIIGKWHSYTATDYNIAVLEEEPYSDLKPNMKRIEYKVSYTGESQARRYTWNDLADRMLDIYYTFNDKELQALSKWLQPLQLQSKNAEEKVIAIEEFIKKEIVFDPSLRQEEFENILHILNKKTTGETGLIKLFTAAFKVAEVKHELGITSNRFEFPLDEKFENWNRTDFYLFYFANSDKYLSPTAITMRYPTVPSVVRGNKAIFCNATAAYANGELASVRSIPTTTLKESTHGLNATISFDPSTMDPLIVLNQSYKGYAAVGLREAALYTPKDREKELILNLTAGIAEQAEHIQSYAFANEGLQHYTDNKPLELNTTIIATHLMESAGGKWLFKVGDVLGPQAQLYDEKKRTLPISMPYAHSLVREISVQIPQGYKIANPEAVKFNITDKAKESGFESDYKLSKTEMTIHINEYYSKDSLPIDDYESFRKVINAAADFNKVTLVLEKE